MSTAEKQEDPADRDERLWRQMQEALVRLHGMHCGKEKSWAKITATIEVQKGYATIVKVTQEETVK